MAVTNLPLVELYGCKYYSNFEALLISFLLLVAYCRNHKTADQMLRTVG